MTTDELIAEIERLNQAATPGPWVVASDLYPFTLLGPEDEEVVDVVEIPYSDIGTEERMANRDLIAAYRTLAVEAAKRLRTMTAACEQAMEWIRADDADAAIYDILNDAISANPLADFGTKDAS